MLVVLPALIPPVLMVWSIARVWITVAVWVLWVMVVVLRGILVPAIGVRLGTVSGVIMLMLRRRMVMSRIIT